MSVRLKRWRSRFERFMLYYAAISHTWLLIQTIEIYTSKDVSSLSIMAFILLVVNSIVWFTYSAWVLEWSNKPIIISACVSFSLATTALVGIILYSDSEETKASLERMGQGGPRTPLVSL